MIMAADFEFIHLTIIFRYWACSDARHNRENPVAFLKELNDQVHFESVLEHNEREQSYDHVYPDFLAVG